jgi:hypothetical protein
MGDTTIRPTRWQERLLALPEDVNVALLGGRGLGKTMAIMLLGLRHVYAHAGRMLIIRRSFPALREIEARLVELFTGAIPGSRYDRDAHILRTPRGGAVELGFLEGEADLQRYLGRECTMLALDEITSWPSMAPLWRLRGNLRSSRGIPTRTVIAGMPGGPGHAGVVSRFIAGRPAWRPWDLAPGDTWVTAGGTLADNPTLPVGYADTLRAACAGDAALLAGWLDGSFEAVGGAFFASQWGEHCIARGDDDWRPGGEGWSSYWSVDWGISSPAVALGIAVPREHGLRGPGGVVYPRGSRIAICEVSSHDPSDPSRGSNWSVDVLAEEMRGAGERYGISRRGCVDDARGLGADETVVSEFRRCGLHGMRRAHKGPRAAGWALLKGMMYRARVRDPDAPWFGMHERCRFSIETISTLPRDPRRVDDCDTTANDHAADAARMAIGYQLGPHGVTPHLVY